MADKSEQAYKMAEKCKPNQLAVLMGLSDLYFSTSQWEKYIEVLLAFCIPFPIVIFVSVNHP